jgi:cell division protease FtsH
MSEMGPLALGKKEGEVFLGREMTTTTTYSEQTAREIDAEVRRIDTEQYERARKILVDNQPMLNKIADALLEHETIDSSDIDLLMSGGSINRPPPVKPPSASASSVAKEPAKEKKPGLLDALGALPKPEPGKA